MALTVQPGRIDEENAAPLAGMLMVIWSPLLGSVPVSFGLSTSVSDQVPLDVTVSCPPRLSVQPLNVTGGVLVTGAVRPDAGVWAIICTLVHVTVMGKPLMVPLSVMLPLFVTVKVVLAGLKLSPASASAAVAASTTTARAAVTVKVILFVIRNMVSVASLCEAVMRRPFPQLNAGSLAGPFIEKRDQAKLPERRDIAYPVVM